MIFSKNVAVVLTAATVTVFTLLGLARIPGGERIGVTLSMAAEELLHEPFDVSLERELDLLQFPQRRELMTHLVMLQVAEHARIARLRAISRADIRGWQVPLPTMAGPTGTGASLRAVAQSAPVYLYKPAQAAEPRGNGNGNGKLVTTLICFLFAIGFAFARRRA